MSKLFKNHICINNDAQSSQITTVMDELEELALTLHTDPKDAEKALKKAIFEVDYRFKVGKAISVHVAKSASTSYSLEKSDELIPIDPIVVNGEGEKKYLRDYKMDIIANLKRGVKYDIKRGVKV